MIPLDEPLRFYECKHKQPIYFLLELHHVKANHNDYYRRCYFAS